MRLASIFTPVALAIFLTGCATTPSEEEHQRIPELESLQGMTVESRDEAIKQATQDGGRLKAIEQVAIASGIHHGRRWRQKRINAWLSELQPKLVAAFNFEQLMIDGVYLPPRVEEVNGHIEKLPDGSIRFIRQAYRITSQPTLVTTTPTYLNYLYQIPDEVDPPNPLGLPEKGTEEVDVWRKGLAKGWQVGVRQADIEFDTDLNLLRRDYAGMQRYLDLVAKGLISMPELTARDFGVVISADGKSLNVGDEVIAITRDPKFQHFEKWEMLEEGP